MQHTLFNYFGHKYQVTHWSVIWFDWFQSFFSSGLTTATFHIWQNSPSLNDRFTILVTVGITEDNSCLKICVGIGSVLQDFDFIAIMMVLTSDSVIGVNCYSFGNTADLWIIGLNANKHLINLFNLQLKEISKAIGQILVIIGIIIR